MRRRRSLVRVSAILGTVALAAACSSSAAPHRGPSSLGPTSLGPSTLGPTSLGPAAASSSASRAASGPRPSRSAAVATTRARTSDQAAPHMTLPRRTTSAAAPHPAPSGLTVVLNPGHDGGNGSHPGEINRQVPAGYGDYKACDTTGTETDAGYPEHAFTWDVALRVRAILRAHGVPVIMTRSNDSGVGPCVDERAAIGNHPNVAAVVSIHADGAPPAGHGFHVNQDARRPDGATAAVAEQSRALGQAEHTALVRSSGLVPSTYIGSDGYYYRTDLAGLNLATRPATFLELGNMKNAGDAALQSSADGRQRIAGAIAAGILAFLGR